MRNFVIPDITKTSAVFSALQMLILSAAELQIRQDEDRNMPVAPLGAGSVLRRPSPPKKNAPKNFFHPPPKKNAFLMRCLIYFYLCHRATNNSKNQEQLLTMFTEHTHITANRYFPVGEADDCVRRAAHPQICGGGGNSLYISYLRHDLTIPPRFPRAAFQRLILLYRCKITLLYRATSGFSAVQMPLRLAMSLRPDLRQYAGGAGYGREYHRLIFSHRRRVAVRQKGASDASETLPQLTKLPADASETFFHLTKLHSDASETSFQPQNILSDASETLFRPLKRLSDASATIFQPQNILSDASESIFQSRNILSDASETLFRPGNRPSDASDAMFLPQNTCSSDPFLKGRQHRPSISFNFIIYMYEYPVY
jgi:hypothetical protein